MSGYDPARCIPFVGTEGISVTDWMKARSIAREHLPPEHGDKRRHEHDADRIRRALMLESYSGHTIEMTCYNLEDKDEIQRLLNPDELLRVIFRY